MTRITLEHLYPGAIMVRLLHGTRSGLVVIMLSSVIYLASLAVLLSRKQVTTRATRPFHFVLLPHRPWTLLTGATTPTYFDDKQDHLHLLTGCSAKV